MPKKMIIKIDVATGAIDSVEHENGRADSGDLATGVNMKGAQFQGVFFTTPGSVCQWVLFGGKWYKV